MDTAAAALGLHPIDIRMRNVRPELRTCLSTLSREPGVADGQGVGYAVAAKHSVAFDDLTEAEVRALPDLRIALATGTCDSGTGSSRALARIAAQVLGASVEEIDVIEGDTGLGPCDLGSTAQRSIFVGGQAAERAARTLRGGYCGPLGACWVAPPPT